MENIDFENMPSITFANGRGDVTITWTEENKKFVKELIANKLEEGYSFFVVVPKKIFGSEHPAVKTALTQKNLPKYIDQVSEAVMIENEDEDFTQHVKLPNYKDTSKRTVCVKQDGLEVAFTVDDRAVETHLLRNEVTLVRKGAQRASLKNYNMKRSADVEEISNSRSIAVRPIVGG